MGAGGKKINPVTGEYTSTRQPGAEFGPGGSECWTGFITDTERAARQLKWSAAQDPTQWQQAKYYNPGMSLRLAIEWGLVELTPLGKQLEAARTAIIPKENV